MSKPELIQAVEVVISFGLLAVCLTVYTKLIVRLVREGGRVRVSGFQISELLVAVVLSSYFGLIIWLNARQGDDGGVPVTINQLTIGSMSFVVYTAGITGFLKVVRRMSLIDVFGLNKVSPIKVAGWAAGLLACAVPVIGLATYATQMTLTKDQLAQQAVVKLFRELSQHGDFIGIAKFSVATIIVAPICEEILFRGFFYGVGKRFLGAFPAAILSAFFFSASHNNLASLAPLFVLALCFTLAYERTGSLLVPMGMHALFNTMNLLFLFGQVRGWFQAP